MTPSPVPGPKSFEVFKGRSWGSPKPAKASKSLHLSRWPSVQGPREAPLEDPAARAQQRHLQLKTEK